MFWPAGSSQLFAVSTCLRFQAFDCLDCLLRRHTRILRLSRKILIDITITVSCLVPHPGASERSFGEMQDRLSCKGPVFLRRISILQRVYSDLRSAIGSSMQFLHPGFSIPWLASLTVRVWRDRSLPLFTHFRFVR
jgi:hypothetical protein